MIIANQVTSLAIDLGDLMGIDVPTFYFAEDNIANVIVGEFLKGEKASALQNGSH